MLILKIVVKFVVDMWEKVNNINIFFEMFNIVK